MGTPQSWDGDTNRVDTRKSVSSEGRRSLGYLSKQSKDPSHLQLFLIGSLAANWVVAKTSAFERKERKTHKKKTRN